MMARTKFKPFAVLACMILVVFALFCIGNTEADAATYSGNCGAQGDNLKWSLDTSTGVLEISGNGEMEYYPASGDISINIDMSFIPWDSYRNYIKSIKIGGAVTSISNNAFRCCTGITSVVVPDSVTTIGLQAFAHCTNLKSISLTKNIKELPFAMLYYCTSLTSLTIPDGVTTISMHAADYCTSLQSIVIPDSVQSIGAYAFASAYSANSLYIGNSVTSIGVGAFGWCGSIQSVTIPKTVNSIAEQAFVDCHSLKNVVINGFDVWNVGGITVSTSVIQNSATMATYLKSTYSNSKWSRVHNYTAVVTSPTCMEHGYTTYTCTACGDSYNGDTVPALGHTYGYDKSCVMCGVKQATVQSGSFGTLNWTLWEDGELRILGTGAMPRFAVNGTPWADYVGSVKNVVIEDGITAIGRCAFYGFENLVSVTLPESLVSIGEYAFYGCSALEEITVPSSVTEIGAYAFRRSALKNATFAIGYGWSAGEDKLTMSELTASAAEYLTRGLYKSVWTRDVNAAPETLDPNYVDSGICGGGLAWTLTMLENGKLKLTISGEGTMTEFSTAGAPWYSYALEIVEIEVSEGVTAIGRCAFYGLKFVRKVTVADTVTAIGDYGFYMCRLLKNIELPEGVTVGKDAFVKTGVTL